MRTKTIALATSLALLSTPVVAEAKPAQQQHQGGPQISSQEFREGSSYLKWLDESVGNTDNEDLNIFLELLVDFLIGAGIMTVAGTIIGAGSRLLR